MTDASVADDQQQVNLGVEAKPAAGGLTIAYLGVLGFVLVQYVRPNDWIAGYERFPFAKIMAGIAIIGFLASLPRAVSTFSRVASAHPAGKKHTAYRHSSGDRAGGCDGGGLHFASHLRTVLPLVQGPLGESSSDARATIAANEW